MNGSICLFSFNKGHYVGCEDFPSVIELNVAVTREGKSGLANHWEKRFPRMDHHFEGKWDNDDQSVTWIRIGNPDR